MIKIITFIKHLLLLFNKLILFHKEQKTNKSIKTLYIKILKTKMPWCFYLAKSIERFK